MENKGIQHTSVTPREYSYQELGRITNNFSKERIIGHGGFGVVYKGILDNGEMIAVKKLYNHLEGLEQFKNELMKLRVIEHPNIVRLLGYCYGTRHTFAEFEGEQIFADTDDRAICLEYLEGGSLQDHLSGKYQSCELHWHVRYKIIKGISEGLKYLHLVSKIPMYHLDLKPANIMLDRNMIPKIGDFGTSRLRLGSMQTCVTQNASGTFGYMPPEYINRQQISQKSDVFSLGVIMIRLIAGEEGFKEYPDTPSQIFIERVHENWRRRYGAEMTSHTSQQVKTCTQIALRCVEIDRANRPSIAEIVDDLNKVDTAESSATGQTTQEQKNTTPGLQPDIPEQMKNNMEHLEEKMKRHIDGRSVVSSPHLRQRVSNEQHTHVHILDLSSREQVIQDHVLHTQSGVQRLKDAIPAMYNLIDEAEWRYYQTCVVELLQKLKDSVYDADDLLDELRWYEMKVKLEGSESKSPFTYFSDAITQGSFNKLNNVQERMEQLSRQLVRLVPCKELRRFDKMVRPETSSSMQYEEKIIGRENELKQVMGFLNVAKNSKRKRAKSSVNVSTSIAPSNRVSNEPRAQSLPVLPIVGIGGVGKTTLAQLICNHKEVKSHFDTIIWICVSDDFDDKRLIKEVLSCSGKQAITDNLDALQRALLNHVNNKRLLIILDDMWDDCLKEHGHCWKRFYSHLRSAQKGSMMLITTRCEKVAKGVGTMEPFELKGLQDDVFWKFFKLCAFGSKNTNNYPDLEVIGKKILLKLKGSPLAAKTLGHMLSMDLQELHWNTIAQSELWELEQEATDILPALRLSYMYLPFYLKRCFSFCAVYPKDYIFEEKYLTAIWMAEGFVESDDIGFQYFQDLVARSFFQRAGRGYVIHDLLHDMAQKVSEDDCFIIKNNDDFDKVPLNVRHIYIHSSKSIVISHLLTLSKHKKLRTIFCKKGFSNNRTNSVLEKWCTDLLHMRVLSCASVKMLPDSIGNLKLLRYLEICEDCPLSIPSSFCWLYHLQILYVKKCKIESLPKDFSNLNCLKRFISHEFDYNQGGNMSISPQSENIGLMTNLNQFRGELVIFNIHQLSKDQAAKFELKNKKDLYKLRLLWDFEKYHYDPMQQNEIEVVQLLQPPVSLMSLSFKNYPDVSLPNWFHPKKLSCLTSVVFLKCDWLDSISLEPPVISQNLNETSRVLVDSNNDSISIYLSLTELRIFDCKNISSLENFLHPDYVPSIKKIVLNTCKSLSSVPTETFKSFPYLEFLRISDCPRLNLQRGLVLPSTLKSLDLNNCGDFSEFVSSYLENLSSLVSLKMGGCQELTLIRRNIFRNKLALLEELYICDCPNLVSVGGAMAVERIKTVYIIRCPKLKEADQIMKRV